jgi:uncharacterized protein YukE
MIMIGRVEGAGSHPSQGASRLEAMVNRLFQLMERYSEASEEISEQLTKLEKEMQDQEKRLAKAQLSRLSDRIKQLSIRLENSELMFTQTGASASKRLAAMQTMLDEAKRQAAQIGGAGGPAPQGRPDSSRLA